MSKLAEHDIPAIHGRHFQEVRVVSWYKEGHISIFAIDCRYTSCRAKPVLTMSFCYDVVMIRLLSVNTKCD